MTLHLLLRKMCPQKLPNLTALKNLFCNFFAACQVQINDMTQQKGSRIMYVHTIKATKPMNHVNNM